MVFKRDGQTEPFKIEKIENAILKAFVEVDGEESKNAKNKAREIASYINSLNKDMSVEEIQDMVEDMLMEVDRLAAKAYIKYRYKRKMARNTTDNTIIEYLSGSNEYWNNEKYIIRLERLCEVMISIDADIFVLEEVELDEPQNGEILVLLETSYSNQQLLREP